MIVIMTRGLHGALRGLPGKDVYVCIYIYIYIYIYINK